MTDFNNQETQPERDYNTPCLCDSEEYIEPCPDKYLTGCSIWNGGDIPELGIKNGDSLNSVLLKFLYAFSLPGQNPLTTIQDTTLNPGGTTKNENTTLGDTTLGGGGTTTQSGTTTQNNITTTLLQDPTTQSGTTTPNETTTQSGTTTQSQLVRIFYGDTLDGTVPSLSEIMTSARFVDIVPGSNFICDWSYFTFPKYPWVAVPQTEPDLLYWDADGDGTLNEGNIGSIDETFNAPTIVAPYKVYQTVLEVIFETPVELKNH